MKTILAILAVLGAAGGGGWWYVSSRPAPPPPGAQAAAKHGTFPILITEMGTFAAKESISLQVRLDVFQSQLSITKVAEAGAAVKKGDVLMEFDTKEIDRMISQAEVEEQAGKNDVIQTTSDLKIQVIDNHISLEKAKSEYDAMVMALKKWNELEGPKAIKEAEVKIRESENALEEAKQSLEVLKKMKQEELVAEAEVKKADLAASKAETDLEFNRLALRLLKEYDHPLKLSSLETAVRDAKSSMDGRESNTEAQRLQKESAKLRAESALREKSSYLEKLRADRTNLVLKAPVDGILLYGDPEQRWNQLKIAVGEKVGAHYPLLTIPDLSALKVNMAVAEADVNKIRVGMMAVIRPEAMPEMSMEASVTKISTVSTNNRSWDENATGKFDVSLDLKGVDPRLKPGMKCKIELVTEEVKDATYVPVDAVFEKDGKPVCWVLGGAKPEERGVKVGRSSHDFAEILEGLHEGDKVALYDPQKEK